MIIMPTLTKSKIQPITPIELTTGSQGLVRVWDGESWRISNGVIQATAVTAEDKRNMIKRAASRVKINRLKQNYLLDDAAVRLISEPTHEELCVAEMWFDAFTAESVEI